MRLPIDHPQRYMLNNEIHARASREVEAPEQISFLAFTYSSAHVDAHADSDSTAAKAASASSPAIDIVFDDLCRLCELAGAPSPPPGAMHFRAHLGQLELNWERHTELVTYAFGRRMAFDHPFKSTAIQQVPELWLDSVRGELLVGIHLAVRDQGLVKPDLRDAAVDFSGNYLVGANVGSDTAIVLTDFRIHEDGFSRMLLLATKMGKAQGGRIVQRLLEIETYRMACLLALPVARQVVQTVAKAEIELAAHTNALTTSVTTSPNFNEANDEAALLKQLITLAATVENQLAATNFRFGAARAYYALVKRRIAELREERLPGLQTIEEFMERRLAPAMNTCESAAQRLFDLSERISRASALLRTRVDIEREQQNQALLASMNRRAKTQLRLQETVEGLSIAAIIYYVVGLIGYFAKGLKAADLPVNPDIAMAASMPLVAGLILFGLRRWRKRNESQNDGR